MRPKIDAAFGVFRDLTKNPAPCTKQEQESPGTAATVPRPVEQQPLPKGSYTMKLDITTPEGLATFGGCAALFASINWTIAHSGSGYSAYLSSSAALAVAGGVGVVAGARALGIGRKNSGKLLVAILAGLMCCEGYNFFMTMKTSVATQAEMSAPLHQKLQKHNDAVERLQMLEAAAPSSMRLTAAQQALADAKAATASQRVRDANTALDRAQAAADAEGADGCFTKCKQKQAEVTIARADLAAAIAAAAQDRRSDIANAERELTTAIADAEATHKADVEAAKADVEANPLPPSPTSMSDTTGAAPWALDLIEALLKSFGINIMATTLIAYGAHRPAELSASTTEETSDVPDSRQTDFSPDEAEAAVKFFRPDPPKSGPGGASDRPAGPKRPGPSGGLSKTKTKGEAFDDLMQRMADGRTIPSDASLASDWNRPKQTVHDWMKKWRESGVIPAATIAGRCKMTVAAAT